MTSDPATPNGGGGGPAPVYGLAAVVVHWSTAVLVLAIMVCGLAMTRLDLALDRTFALYQLHKSLGLTILALTGIRLVLRLRTPSPVAPGGVSATHWRLARLGHALLIAASILAALTGWAMVSVSTLDLPTSWFGLFDVPHLPGLAGLSIERRAYLEPLLRSLHGGSVALLAVLIAGHAGRVAWHGRAGTPVLARMLPRRRRSP